MATPQPLFTRSDIEALEQALACRGLHIDLRGEWGSNFDSEHRLKIRTALDAAMVASVASSVASSVESTTTPVATPNWVTDLSVLPNSATYHTSISHSRNLGGFAFCDQSSNITGLGFDLENLSRLGPAVIKRVSEESERVLAPDPRFLWSAKEAAFKGALGPYQPIAITEIVIGAWKSPSENLYRFEAKTAELNLGRGVIKLDPRNDEVFAFFAGNPLER